MDYKVQIKTKNTFGAGTDAKVYWNGISKKKHLLII